MNDLKRYECRMQFYDAEIISHHIVKSASKARYQFYKKHFDDITYAECFKYIKVKTLGVANKENIIPTFFGDFDKFKDVCKRRNIEFAYQGMKIDVNGKQGWIVGANSHNNLDVLFGEYHIHNCHPTWETTYYDNNDNIIKDFKEKK